MPAAAPKLTDKEIGTYLVYRMKINELIHLNFLWLSLKDGNCGETIEGVPKNLVMESLRTAHMAWFATVVDESSLQIFNLWRKMFPEHQARIEKVWAELQPHLGLIRRFRNKTAFHADISFPKFFEPTNEFGMRQKGLRKVYKASLTSRLSWSGRNIRLIPTSSPVCLE